MSNLIGTAEGECRPDGTVTGRTVYSAFGEVVGTSGNPASRYGYAGAWGYQSARSDLCGADGEEFACDPLAELGWLHVGERYYDPQSGRFVQRDPIGIDGGASVYVYVGNRPTVLVDPLGRMPLWLANAILTITGGSDRNILDDRELMDGIGEGAFYVGAGDLLPGT